MDLLALADFNLVAAHGGFGRASRASGKPKATLSRRVRDLEESLGVRLLERGVRSVVLTEEGKSLFARTEGLLREIGEVGEGISAGLDRPHGSLRVSAPVLLAHVALGRIAADFARDYPEVRLEIVAEDRLVDPVDDNYDVVIRVNPVPNERLIGRCFLHDELVVVAVKSLDRPVRIASDVPTVPAVTLNTSPAGAIWQVSNGEDSESFSPNSVLRLSSLFMVREAVRAGAGAGLLPRFIVADDIEAGRLAYWGAALDKPVSIWALHPSRRLTSTKVKAFLHCLVEAFPDRAL